MSCTEPVRVEALAYPLTGLHDAAARPHAGACIDSSTHPAKNSVSLRGVFTFAAGFSSNLAHIWRTVWRTKEKGQQHKPLTWHFLERVTGIEPAS